MGNRQSIITLLTDFGNQDYFVGAMKGVILSINPTVHVVDISHEIPPQDIEAAAFALLCCYQNFPAGTIHVAVVDPGVGSDRKPTLIECAHQVFVGPDNGLFSWICEREPTWSAIQLTNERFFRHPVSRTFHGRDIFAPVAAALSKGTSPQEFGGPLTDVVRLDSLQVKSVNESTIEGRIIHIDRFGNCVTNLTAADLSSKELASSWRLVLNDREIDSLRQFFAEDQSGEVFCTVGSAGFLELAARNDSAARILDAKRGQSLLLVSSPMTRVRARLS
ncbi:MAG TPA: SAM-dependent chlorinase/fluorinase [Candidatus Binatia bacterium]